MMPVCGAAQFFPWSAGHAHQIGNDSAVPLVFHFITDHHRADVGAD